jgi:hypothetical protein
MSALPDRKTIFPLAFLIIMGQLALTADNYIKYNEKIELFISRFESQVQATKDQAQKLQLKNILNELDNGILILDKIPKLTAEYAN